MNKELKRFLKSWGIVCLFLGAMLIIVGLVGLLIKVSVTHPLIGTITLLVVTTLFVGWLGYIFEITD